MKSSCFILFSCLMMITAYCPAQDVSVPEDQPTISAALSAVSTGDTIIITDGGTYTEDIIWNKNCTLTSTGGIPTLSGNQSIQADMDLSRLNMSAPAGANVIDVSGDFLQIAITGCTISEGDYGIYAEDSADSLVISVSDCLINNTGTRGIHLTLLENLTFNMESTVISEAGIRLPIDSEDRRPLNIKATNSLVTLIDSTFISSEDGTEDRIVNIHSTAETLIMDNCSMQVPPGDPDGDGLDARARFGLYIDSGGSFEKNVILRDTSLRGNVHEVSIGKGNPGNIIMERCDFTCTGTWKAFQLWEMVQGTHIISDSTFHATDADGEALFWQQNYGSTATFTNCFFSGGDKAFRLRQNNTGQTQHLSFSGCHFSGSDMGVSHTDGNETNTTMVFNGCTFDQNTDAFRIEHAGVAFDIRDCTFSSNGWDIHQVAGGNEYQLEGSTFLNTTGDSILLSSGTSNLDATNCTFFGPGESCIRLESGAGLVGSLNYNIFSQWGSGSFALELEGIGLASENFNVFVDTDNVQQDFLDLSMICTREAGSRFGSRLIECFCDPPGNLTLVSDGLAGNIDGAGNHAGSQSIGCEIVSSASLWSEYR